MNPFHAEGASLYGSMYLVPLLQEMNRRSAVNPLDKICGLAYLLDLQRVPTYSLSLGPEEAWKHLVHILDYKLRLELLVQFPYPGTASNWMPTWEQVASYPPGLYQPDSDPLFEVIFSPKITPNCSRFSVTGLGYLPNVKLRHGDNIPGQYNVEYEHWLTGTTNAVIEVDDKNTPILDGEYSIFIQNSPMLTQRGLLCSLSPSHCEDHTALQKITPIRTLSSRWLYLHSPVAYPQYHCCFS